MGNQRLWMYFISSETDTQVPCSPCFSYPFLDGAVRYSTKKTFQRRKLHYSLSSAFVFEENIRYGLRRFITLPPCLNKTNLIPISAPFRYAYSNEVGNYGSPYGYSQSVATPQNMGYDISADYVDSTTTYEPRSTTIIDTDFIGGHSKYNGRTELPITNIFFSYSYPLVFEFV